MDNIILIVFMKISKELKVKLNLIQILITDWMLSPEFYLKRPVDKYPESRLDKTLLRAA